MRRPLAISLVLLAGLCVAPSAFGSSSAHATTVDLRIGEQRVATTGAVPRFTLAGVSWRGSGRVALRTRSTGGRWSAWRPAAPEAEDGPDAGSPEQRRAGWRLGNPFWVGPSDRLEARVAGNVTRVRAQLVWSPEVRIPLRVPSSTGTPPIMPRLSWGADESIRRGPPTYAPAVRFAIVHHTAGRNDYSRAEAAAIVKGIQLFHVQGNGWNDIGYNFLVDRFGTIYEGRFGGIDRNVVGAHALGFNTGSVGIALLGTYGDAKPSAAAQDAIARLIAWRLDLAHVDPTSFLTFISGGSERYANGIPVLLSAVSGHRDTGFTECPGNALYSRLGAIAASARALGGPKIFDPKAEVKGTAIRVRAQLSQSQPWSVAMTSSTGVEVARGAGTGTAVDWTWESGGTPAGAYTWTIAAGTARPATGVLRAGGGTAPLTIDTAVAEPEAISPNEDGQADTATLTYRISDGRQRDGRDQGCDRRPDGDRGRPGVDASRAAHSDDRRTRALRRRLQRGRHGSQRGGRVGSAGRPAASEPHSGPRDGRAARVLAQRRRAEGSSESGVLPDRACRRPHPRRARRALGGQPVDRELPDRDAGVRVGRRSVGRDVARR